HAHFSKSQEPIRRNGSTDLEPEFAERRTEGMNERDQMEDQERPVRVLVVDDEPLIVEMLTMGLNYEGFEVSVARTGFEALEQAQRTKPDLVVLDVMLPGLDGVEV